MAYVRKLLSTDNRQVMRLATEMHKDSQYAHLPFNESRVEGLLKQLIADDWSAGFVGVTDDGEIVGFMGMYIQPYMFTAGLTAQDIALYVKPSWRMSSIPLRMIRAAESWAKDAGAHSVVLAVSAPYDPAKTTNMYSKLQYQPWGSIMRKEFV